MDAPERRHRRKPGPKAEIPNPRPVGDPAPFDVLLVDLLADEARTLREYFKKQRTALTRARNESVDSAVKRICDLVEHALDQTGVGWWSALRREEVQASARVSGLPKGKAARFYYLRHVGPNEPTKRAQHGAMRVFHEGNRKLLKRWDKKSKSWGFVTEVDGWASTVEGVDLLSQQVAKVTYSFRRLRPRFAEAVKRMVSSTDLGRVAGSGRPHYLACSMLAALLDTTPEQINDRLNHYLRSRNPKRRG